MTGIIVAVLTGLVLRLTILNGQPAPFIMELPPYHLPSLKAMILQAWQRNTRFYLESWSFYCAHLCIDFSIKCG